MKKVRLTVTVVFEHELNPDYYPDATTDEERINAEIQNHSDPIFLADSIGNDCHQSLEVKVELIPDDEKGATGGA